MIRTELLLLLLQAFACGSCFQEHALLTFADCANTQLDVTAAAYLLSPILSPRSLFHDSYYDPSQQRVEADCFLFGLWSEVRAWPQNEALLSLHASLAAAAAL
eukprot:GHUV01038609.1.p2 GENE.GHUV01038609.1~~GHUV01038609.1.p2  ORF type:complete len:103 (+),score=0.45 GHUV01038609.1:864-1172(+)